MSDTMASSAQPLQGKTAQFDEARDNVELREVRRSLAVQNVRRRLSVVRRITAMARAVGSSKKREIEVGNRNPIKTTIPDILSKLTMHKNGQRVPTKGYGTLDFPTSDTSSKKVAAYCRVSVQDNPQDALHFVQAVITRKLGRGYPRPSLIISVTGGAKSFTLPSRLMSVIRKGLMRAADTTNAWVVTGGTHSGVMELVGSFMRDLNKDRYIPVIGIATHGIVEGRHDLTTDDYRDRLDIPYTHQNFKSLDSNHNIFLLVDDGSDNQFGKEIEFRAQFEKAASEDYDVPVVTVVIQGGPGTLKTAHDAVICGTPIVVVDGSGQAADVIAYAWDFLHSDSLAARSYTMADLKQKIADTFPGRDVDELTQQVMDIVEFKEKVWVYSLQDLADKSLDDVILKAVFYGSDATLKNKLKQAMFFDRLDVAKAALDETQSKLEADEKELESILNDNLMWSLTHNKPGFVDLYLDHGARVAHLKPTAEYAASEQLVPVVRDHRGHSMQLPSVALAIEELYIRAAKSEHSHVRRLAELSQIKGKEAYRNQNRMYCLPHMEAIMAGLMAGSFTIERDWTLYSESRDDVSERELDNFAYHMLLTWAICLDKFRMAKMFWVRGDQSISNALVASRMLHKLSSSRALSGPHLADEREKMAYNAKKFEHLAVGVLGQCQSADADLTTTMLHMPIPRFKNRNAIRVAFESESLAFLSHPAAQTLVNRDWWGGMRSSNNVLVLMLCLLLPFFIPFVIKFRARERTPNALKASTVDISAIDDDDDDDTFEEFGRSLPQRFRTFYTAPITRFCIDGMTHLALCLFFSYMVLDNIKDTVSVVEIIVMIWFGSLFAEELRQLVKNDGFREYIQDAWNRLDVIMLTLYVIGLGFRLSDLTAQQAQVNAKSVFSLAAIAIWLRLMRYYAVSEFLGPKLIMMARMGADVFVFVLLLAIFLIGYGVAAQGILYPLRNFDYQSFENVLFRPYFQIYGELFLEDIEADSDCIGPWQFSSCGWKLSWLVPILLAIYILVTNILLVNLLIAMFNDTYINVQEGSRQYWHKQNYELLLEYRDRPVLPAPVILIEHVIMMLRYFCNLCVSKHHTHFTEEEQARISVFQESCTDKYLRKLRRDEEDDIASKISNNSDKLLDLTAMAVELQQSLLHLRGAVDRQPSSPLGVLSRNSSALSSRALHVAGIFVPELVYPNTSVKRFPVPLDKCRLSVPFPEYKPVDYSMPGLGQKDWADPDDPLAIKTFNQNDGVVNRVSYGGEYGFDSKHRPINMFGRTGMVGRGCLGRWGPNHACDAVVTRWRRTKQGAIMERDGKKVLEFIAIRRKDNGMWAVPGGFVDAKEDPEKATAREFLEEAMDKQEGLAKVDAEQRHAVEGLFAHGERVYEGYSEDNRNTDNAWVETTVTNFHDDSGKFVGKLTLQGGDDARAARWMMVHSGQRLFAMHSKFLRLVAENHSAYW